jgi:hypothetical protein
VEKLAPRGCCSIEVEKDYWEMSQSTPRGQRMAVMVTVDFPKSSGWEQNSVLGLAGIIEPRQGFRPAS